MEVTMAEIRTNQSDTTQGGRGKELTHPERERQGLQRWQSQRYGGPFDLFDRISDEMDRTFGRVFRDLGIPGGGLLSRRAAQGGQGLWTPRVEAFQQGDRFIVRAELPGLKKDDVQVELTDEALTIRGERRSEQQEEREGVYLTEREYGEFYRVIPLPDGVISESAQATFKDGLLEITLQAPPAEANRGRRLEIQDASVGSQKDKR
jgi:HSP20 family protein